LNGPTMYGSLENGKKSKCLMEYNLRIGSRE
jgi:hypothetical protein